MPRRDVRSLSLSISFALIAVPGSSLASAAVVPGDERDSLLGHSHLGQAFDEGPRAMPWKIDGIGRTHFEITTSVREVQDWFDQGHTLLHSYWYREAERAFRWCLKLDPDCAMAWWGLARTSYGRREMERGNEFLEEAMARADHVTDRERRYLDAWWAAYGPALDGEERPPSRNWWAPNIRLAEELQKIVLSDPDDLEARALLAKFSIFDSGAFGVSLILQQILDEQPDHPGAHHYLIHNWDGELGAQALDSCAAYGKIAWYSGHANHLSGHVYSKIGMWHEGAISMDAATRVEKASMQQRMVLPYNCWNYAHNRNYLAFIQEQLGMPSASLIGARDLVRAPLDPDANDPDARPFSAFGEGFTILLRNLIRYERWDLILDGETIPWRDSAGHKAWRPYADGLAHLGRGELDAAQKKLVTLQQVATKEKGELGRAEPFVAVQIGELHGLLELACGKTLEGLHLLTTAADAESGLRKRANDPPPYPRFLRQVLGEVYLGLDSPKLARECFLAGLESVPNDAFCLAGLTRAEAALGNESEAEEAYSRLRHVWSGAEAGLRWMDECVALGIDAEPVDFSPASQRNYTEETLATLGPNQWVPYPAPRLEARDAHGYRVTLEDYAGTNVLLVLYLGAECPHCLDQLRLINERASEFEDRNTALLAISADTPDENTDSSVMEEFGLRLLSDRDFENARRFQAYDDFEEIDLHATVLIDDEGRIRWSRNGGDPFEDVDFLLREIDRWTGLDEEAEAIGGGGLPE